MRIIFVILLIIILLCTVFFGLVTVIPIDSDTLCYPALKLCFPTGEP